MISASGDSVSRREVTGPVILVVAQEFAALLEPLRWLHDAGYDVRACLGPLGADRVCGLFEGGCTELSRCDLLVTNYPPARAARVLPPVKEVVREARLRREELPVLVVHDPPEGLREAARALKARVAAPRRDDVLVAVEELIGPPAGLERS